MFKKWMIAAAAAMVVSAPAMAYNDLTFESGNATAPAIGWIEGGPDTTVARTAYDTGTFSVDYFTAVGGYTDPGYTMSSPDAALGGYYGLVSGGSSFGVQTSYLFGYGSGLTSAAGDRLYYSIVSWDNVFTGSYNAGNPVFSATGGRLMANGGDFAQVTFYDAGGSTLNAGNTLVSTGISFSGAVTDNWFYVDVPTGTSSFKVTLFQGDATNVGQLAVDYKSAAAVPEPETYAMMLAGLGALGFMARRRKSA